MKETLKQQLQTGLTALHLDTTPQLGEQLLQLLALLQQWNATYNLTAIKASDQIISHHFLDSLSVLPYLNGQRILDVGTGAGFPGLPLALACPEREFTLLDGNGKKTRFLLQACAELGVENVQIVQSRVEKYEINARFDVIISRALGSLRDLVQQTQHLLANDGCWLAMKGQYPQHELDELTHPARVESLQVPGLDAERHLVIIRE